MELRLIHSPGEFSMEYKKHAQVLPHLQKEMIEAFQNKTLK